MLHRFPASDLIALRERAMLSDYDVQRMTGISRMTLYDLEKGRRKPRTTTIRRLLNLYAIHISKLEHIQTSWQTSPPEKRTPDVAGVYPPRSLPWL